MAKKSSIEKNERRLRIVERYAEKRSHLKKIMRDKNLSLSERFAAQMKLAELPRDSASNRVRNRCKITGRARGYYRDFKMSRICLRSLANAGELAGVIKASW